MMEVDRRPVICPECGELVIAWCCTALGVLLYPAHEDIIFPGTACAAAAFTAPSSPAEYHSL